MQSCAAVVFPVLPDFEAHPRNDFLLMWIFWVCTQHCLRNVIPRAALQQGNILYYILPVLSDTSCLPFLVIYVKGPFLVIYVLASRIAKKAISWPYTLGAVFGHTSFGVWH